MLAWILLSVNISINQITSFLYDIAKSFYVIGKLFVQRKL